MSKKRDDTEHPPRAEGGADPLLEKNGISHTNGVAATATVAPETTRCDLTPEEIAAYIEAHEKWCNSRGVRRQKTPPFDFGREALSALERCPEVFEGKCLRGARLQGVCLPYDADLTGTDLRDADLRGADMSRAKNLTAAALTGADLEGAKLPDGIGWDKNLTSIEKMSANAARAYLSLLAAAGFLLLVVARTTDPELLSNNGTVKLPVIGADVDLRTMFVLGPIILLTLYVVFAITLKVLWEEIATLPAIFPDGVPFPRKTTPWLFNDMGRNCFPRLSRVTPAIDSIQDWLCRFLAYGLPLVTILAFWGRYLCRHDLFVTGIHCGMFGASAIVVFVFASVAVNTLKRNRRVDRLDPRLQEAPRTLREFSPYLPVMGMAAACLLLIAGLSYGALLFSRCAINGVPTWLPDENRAAESVAPYVSSAITAKAKRWYSDVRDYAVEVPEPTPVFVPSWETVTVHRVLSASFCNEWAGFRHQCFPLGLSWMQVEPFINLEGAELSRLPPDYASKYNPETESAEKAGADAAPDVRYAVRAGANLRNMDLRFANLRRAFLVNADLRGTDLRCANLEGADLRGIKVDDKTQWEGANLRNAYLNDTRLNGVRWRGAYLYKAWLKRANLRGADLSEAILDGAQLQGAELQMADLARASLCGARLDHAHLEYARFDGASLCTPRSPLAAKGRRTSLRNVTLRATRFRNADLRGADFTGAHLGEKERYADDDTAETVIGVKGNPRHWNEAGSEVFDAAHPREEPDAFLEGALWRAPLELSPRGANRRKASPFFDKHPETPPQEHPVPLAF